MRDEWIYLEGFAFLRVLRVLRVSRFRSVPAEADQDHRPVRPRWLHRRCGAHPPEGIAARHRPTHRHREQTRRGIDHRNERSRKTAAPDGYTMVMISTPHVISPHLYKSMPYDPIKDFTPAMKLAEGPYVLVVHPSLPAKSVAELIALARAQPDKIDYASSGNGSSQHLVGALFTTMANAPMNHVPYKGSSQAMNDVLGGQVKVSFVGVPNALPNLVTGKIKALAVTT